MAEAMSSGGMQTTRLNTAYEDVRDDARRQARRGLAAVACREFGGYETVKRSPQLKRQAAERFAELLDFFGLDVVPEGRPGICRRQGCDRPLPMASASTSGSPSRPHWRQGYCSLKCWTED